MKTNIRHTCNGNIVNFFKGNIEIGFYDEERKFLKIHFKLNQREKREITNIIAYM